MPFIIRMALRELRASWARLLFFFICVAIGVGSIVTLRSIIQNVRAALAGEARAMIAADVSIQTNRPWTPEVRADLDRRLAEAPVLARAESVETATMVRPEAGSSVARMVELRGVEASFPFYGTLTLQGGAPYHHDLIRDGGALVRPELLAQLDVEMGDTILIGGHPFTIRGAIDQEPGRRVGGFSFGSRVLVDLDDLHRTGLLVFGSRASYQILLRVREDAVARLTNDIRTEFRDRFVNARSFLSTEDQMGEDLQRAENFLSLVGFVIVVLGGIGVWSVTRVFVRQKIRSVAILKCLGASTGQVLGTYVLQVSLLALTGSLLGVAFAAAALAALPESLTAALGDITYGLTWSAVGQGLLVGLLVSLLFALVPLLDIRTVKPLLLLRGVDMAAHPAMTRLPGAPRGWQGALARVGAAFGRADWLQISAGVLVAVALLGVAGWQAGSLRAGAVVTVGFAAISLILYAAAWLFVRAVMPLSAATWFPLRHAVISLRRPGNQTRVILLAVGLGCFFVLGIRALQDNLVSEFVVDVDRSGADMFLVDVQQDQVEGIRALVAGRQDAGGPEPRLVPVLRARVTGIRDSDAAIDGFGDARGRGLGREYVITYRTHLEANETVAEGRFREDGGGAEVSVESGLSERAGIGLGDRMRFDILGRPIEATVTSIRNVRWEDGRSGGFMFVFSPQLLAEAPHSYIGFVRGPSDLAARGRLQHDLVAGYPNVSVIDGREILDRVQAIVDNVVLAITIVGGIALFSGVLILVGAVAMTRFQRVYEAAILRTLGASTRTLTTMVTIEYCALGLLAGAIGAAGALGLSWAVTRHVLDIPWRPAPGLLSVGAVLTMLLVAAIGVLSSAGILRKKPLATLRAE
ncbi:MAG: ABC transporter permease [Acidobacteria bacterium]|nr:ABC transporter permease [Acidobacteriota bacterium]